MNAKSYALTRWENLCVVIERHDQLYYGEANPVISDFEYDALMRELEEIEDRYPEFITPNSPSQRVGWSPSS